MQTELTREALAQLMDQHNMDRAKVAATLNITPGDLESRLEQHELWDPKAVRNAAAAIKASQPQVPHIPRGDTFLDRVSSIAADRRPAEKRVTREAVAAYFRKHPQATRKEASDAFGVVEIYLSTKLEEWGGRAKLLSGEDQAAKPDTQAASSAKPTRESVEALLDDNPEMTREAIAARLGVSAPILGFRLGNWGGLRSLKSAALLRRQHAVRQQGSDTFGQVGAAVADKPGPGGPTEADLERIMREQPTWPAVKIAAALGFSHPSRYYLWLEKRDIDANAIRRQLGLPSFRELLKLSRGGTPPPTRQSAEEPPAMAGPPEADAGAPVPPPGQEPAATVAPMQPAAPAPADPPAAAALQAAAEKEPAPTLQAAPPEQQSDAGQEVAAVQPAAAPEVSPAAASEADAPAPALPDPPADLVQVVVQAEQTPEEKPEPHPLVKLALCHRVAHSDMLASRQRSIEAGAALSQAMIAEEQAKRQLAAAMVQAGVNTLQLPDGVVARVRVEIVFDEEIAFDEEVPAT